MTDADVAAHCRMAREHCAAVQRWLRFSRLYVELGLKRERQQRMVLKLADAAYALEVRGHHAELMARIGRAQ